MVLACLCGRSPISITALEGKDVTEAPLQKIEKKNSSSWEAYTAEVPTVLRIREIAFHFVKRELKPILKKCLFIESVADRNSRGSFAQIICDLEGIRSNNGWSFDGDFNGKDVPTKKPQKSAD